MKFISITYEHLSQMKDILNESAGYEISLADELAYFDSTEINGWWLSMTSDGQPIAFIRHFKQNSNWSLGEIFISPKIQDRAFIANALLEKFQNSVQFPKAHRLKFDINSHDEVLNRTLKEKGFSEKNQVFRFLECFNIAFDTSSKTQPISVLDAREVSEVLSHLHPVSANDVKKWIEKGTILAVRDQGKIVSAAQIYEFDDAIEVNRFATHEKYLRQGFAKKMMNAIFQQAGILTKKYIFLRVADDRIPAITFYRSVGFLENPKKCQIRHSRWY